MDDTARRLERLQALTGQSVQVEDDALRVAVALGVADADAGAFSDRTVDEIFAQGMAQAKQATPDRD